MKTRKKERKMGRKRRSLVNIEDIALKIGINRKPSLLVTNKLDLTFTNLSYYVNSHFLSKSNFFFFFFLYKLTIGVYFLNITFKNYTLFFLHKIVLVQNLIKSCVLSVLDTNFSVSDKIQFWARLREIFLNQIRTKFF